MFKVDHLPVCVTWDNVGNEGEAQANRPTRFSDVEGGASEKVSGIEAEECAGPLTDETAQCLLVCKELHGESQPIEQSGVAGAFKF